MLTRGNCFLTPRRFDTVHIYICTHTLCVILLHVHHQVTNPVSAEYRSFKTASEVLGMIAPAASDVDEVIMWLATRGYDTLQRYVFLLMWMWTFSCSPTVELQREGIDGAPAAASVR